MNVQSIGPTYLCRRKMIADKIGDIKPTSILEVGCGSGDLARKLSKNYDYTGIDLNRNNIDKIKKDNISGTFHAIDLFDLKTKKKFDLVICFEVIEHVKYDKKFMKKLTSFIKPGGQILISTPGRRSKWGSNDVLAGHFRRYNVKDFIDVSKNLHLSDVKIYSIGFPIANIFKYYNDFRAKRVLSNTKERNLKKLTIDSGVKKSSKIFSYLFNDITMYPFYIIQDMFSWSSLGINYLLVAKNETTN